MFFVLSVLSAMADPGTSIVLSNSNIEVETSTNTMRETHYTISSTNNASPVIMSHAAAIPYLLHHGSEHPDLDFILNPEIVRDIVVIDNQQVFCACTGILGNAIGCFFKFSHDGEGNTVVECAGMCDNSYPGASCYPCEMVDENNDPIVPGDSFAGQVQSE